MKTIIVIAFILIGIFSISQVAMTYYSSNSIEHPKYKVQKRFKNFEIRYYPELVIASTKIANNTYENSSSQGFRTIAGYIFGGNEENLKISMTSPVRMDMSDSIEMSFYMPSQFTLNNLPKPSSNNVVLTKQESQVVAAIQFSGWANSKKINDAFNELKQQLDLNNIAYKNKCTYLGYNPPYQIVNRKNEVIVQLKNFTHE